MANGEFANSANTFQKCRWSQFSNSHTWANEWYAFAFWNCSRSFCNSNRNNRNLHFMVQTKLVEINSQKRRWEMGFSFYQKCYLIFFCLLFRLNYPFLPLQMQSKGLLWMVARYEQINPILTLLPFFLSTFLETC